MPKIIDPIRNTGEKPKKQSYDKDGSSRIHHRPDDHPEKATEVFFWVVGVFSNHGFIFDFLSFGKLLEKLLRVFDMV